MKELIKKLEAELANAVEKESLAQDDWRNSGASTRFKHGMVSAQSYTNGIMEALDIVRRHKEEL